MERRPSHAEAKNEKGSTIPSDSAESFKSSIAIFDEPHRDAVTRAVSRVLSTAIAETTYAQIVNGLPLPEVVNDSYGDIFPDDHPIYQHTHLKEGTLFKLRRFRRDCDLNVLQFDTPLLSAFQAASAGSKAFHTRLIEIVAIAVHQFAVLLYQNNTGLSRPATATQAVHTWTPPRDSQDGELWWQFNPDAPPATLFHHVWYREHAQYADGVADRAGYWAENRVLGGVVLFNREEAEEGGDVSNSVYIHPDRDEVTHRICLLADAQKEALLDFFLLDTPNTCPLPIIPDGTNTHRVDPEEPFWYTGVYRDKWERAMPPPEWMGDGRASCVWHALDFPTKADHREANSRWRSRGDRR